MLDEVEGKSRALHECLMNLQLVWYGMDDLRI
jgi:hypothetical protein